MKPMRAGSRLQSGDIVVVRPFSEILRTLDSNGTLDQLPFMPEMLEYCGKQFRVLNRVVQATIDGAFLTGHTESYVREFKNNDVVILNNVRCSGASHDGCQRACALFWKDAWLEKIDGGSQNVALGESVVPDFDQLHAILKTRTAPGKYFCQSTEFLKATLHLSGIQRIRKCVTAVSVGNVSSLRMMKRILVWMWSKGRTTLVGERTRGTQKSTPTEVLNLEPGELVEVKSLPEIVMTLSRDGRNLGLHFSADQRPLCGRRYRVKCRADKFIAEGIGEMKQFSNTVILEDVLCDSAFFAFGGCYRSDLLYWREIWLKRVE